MNALEKAAQRIDAKLRASGRTVTVTEPSDTNVFVATLPRGRRPQAKSRGK
jgi:hypothetical protein